MAQYQFYTKKAIDAGVDFANIFPEKQAKIAVLKNVSYSLPDIVEFLKVQTNNFTKQDERFIDLDNAVRRIVSMSESAKTITETPKIPEAINRQPKAPVTVVVGKDVTQKPASITPMKPAEPTEGGSGEVVVSSATKDELQATIETLREMLEDTPDDETLQMSLETVEEMLDDLNASKKFATGGSVLDDMGTLVRWSRMDINTRKSILKEIGYTDKAANELSKMDADELPEEDSISINANSNIVLMATGGAVGLDVNGEIKYIKDEVKKYTGEKKKAWEHVTKQFNDSVERAVNWDWDDKTCAETLNYEYNTKLQPTDITSRHFELGRLIIIRDAARKFPAFFEGEDEGEEDETYNISASLVKSIIEDLNLKGDNIAEIEKLVALSKWGGSPNHNRMIAYHAIQMLTHNLAPTRPSPGKFARGGEFANVIGEDRAKQIIKSVLKEAKSKGVSLPNLQKFMDEGAKPGVLIEAYEEFHNAVNNGGNPKSLRVAYEDSNRFRTFVKSHFPDKTQREMMAYYGETPITTNFPGYEKGGTIGEKYKAGDFVFAPANHFDTRIKDESAKIPFFVLHWSHDKYYVTGDGSHYIAEDQLTPATEKDFNDYYGDNASEKFKHALYADGGGVPDRYSNVSAENLFSKNGSNSDSNYSGKTPEQVWKEWSPAQRTHFIVDHTGKQHTERSQETLSKKTYKFLPADIKKALTKHISVGQYAKGGGVKSKNKSKTAKKK